MFIEKDFFTGDIFIANLNETCDNLTLMGWIEEWEEQCLRIVLGDCLYDEFISQFEWKSDKYVLKSDADVKWDWLLNGHSYAIADINQSLPSDYHNCGCGCNGNGCDSYKWDGLVKITNRKIPTIEVNGCYSNAIQIKKSLIADYIYWMYSLNEDSFTSSTGEQIAEVKGGSRVSNSHKRINAHNKFVSAVIECNNHGKVGLYRFVQDFRNLYPEWGGKCLKYESIW